MRDGAAVAVAAHRGAAGRLAARPTFGFGVDPQPVGGPVHRGGGSLHAGGRRDRLVVQRQRGLDQTDHSGAALQVPGVRFDRADHAGPVRAARAVHRGQRGQFDGVTGRGAGPVRLHEIDAGRVDTGGAAGHPEHLLLCRTVGRHDADGPAVLGDGPAAHDGQHPVVVALRVGQPFEHHHRGTFTAAVAVGGLIEGFAPPVRGGGPGDVQHPGQAGSDQGADAAGQGQRGLAGAQQLAGLMHGDQGGRAGGVQRDAGATQIEQVGDPVGDTAQRGADPGPGLDSGEVLHDEFAVVVGVHAHQHRGVAAGQ